MTFRSNYHKNVFCYWCGTKARDDKKTSHYRQMHPGRPVRLLRKGEVPYVPCYLNWVDVVDYNTKAKPIIDPKYNEEYGFKSKYERLLPLAGEPIEQMES